MAGTLEPEARSRTVGSREPEAGAGSPGSREPEAAPTEAGSREPKAGSPKVALIDYGAGNLTSVRKALEAAGAEVMIAGAPAQLERCHGIVVPGVGNFQRAASLHAEWRQAIFQGVDAGIPLLGICLGMQLLFDGSDEAPDVPGLGLFDGRCARIAAQRPLKVPHVGWNSLSIERRSEILHAVEPGSFVYFTHAFAAPVTASCAASAVHGAPFAAVVECNRVAGVQFHPEKSGETGLQILRNFVTSAVS